MKKTAAILLSFSLLLAQFSLVSCSESAENSDTESTNTAVVPDDTASESVIDEDTRPMHAIPESADYEGAIFNIMYPEWQGYQYYFFADEANGDAMNDAIFNRTLKTEDYLNVDITQYSPGYIGDILPTLRQCVTAQDDSYHLALTHCIQDVGTMVTSGYLYNFDDLTNVDYTADWWNREMMDVLRLGDNTYYGVSDYMIPCPYAIFFSKDMVAEYNLANPYELVYNGEWTIDNFGVMAQAVVRDADGDGKYSTSNDIWGVCCEEDSKYISFMTGAEQYMTTRDENNRIVLDMNTEKLYSLLEKFSALATMNGVIAPHGSLSVTNGNLLFELHTIAHAVNYRDTEIDIGILPYPKYDEAQENYVSLDWGGLMGIPSSILNPDMVGAVLEVLSYESGNEVIPTYYDVLLEGKLARDADTVAMLDILFDTIAYEVGGNYFGFDGTLRNMFYAVPDYAINSQKAFASFYRSGEKVSKKLIEKYYESLEKVEAGIE